MSRISNKAAYPPLSQPALADYVVITDANKKLATKTVSLNGIKNLFQLSYNDITIEVSSAELLALYTVPKTLLPAPGVGRVYDIFSIFAYLDAGVTAYDFVDPVQVKQGASVWAELPTASLMNAGADSAAHFQKQTLALPINTSVLLQAQGANATVGAGILKINIRYRNIELQSF